MAGWALFVGLAAAALIASRRLGYPFPLHGFALAAVALAAAGYAWQGHPADAGRPTTGIAHAVGLDDETIALRSAMFGRFGAVASYFTVSDALLRYGAPGAAAQFIQAGIGREPHNVALWTQLGILIATRDRAVSPAALFAFRRAEALGPADPAPAFFLGLANVRAGRFAQARTAWQRALALTPVTYPYHDAIAERLGLLETMLQRHQAG